MHDEAAADAARAAVEVDDVVDAAARAEEMLRDRAEARVVADERRQRDALSTSARIGASVHPRCGARRTRPSDARTSPGTASPTATMRAGQMVGSPPSTVRATSSAVSSGLTRWSTSMRSRTTSPSRPTAAIVTASTSGFTVRR